MINTNSCINKIIYDHIITASQSLKDLYAATSLQESGEYYECLGICSEANLDGLRIAEYEAFNLVRNHIEDDDDEIASVAALLFAELEINQPAASAEAVSLLHHESPEIRMAAWRGLRLAKLHHVGPHLRAILGKSNWDFEAAVALDVLAFHRQSVTGDFGLPIVEDVDEVSWLLAEAGGRMRGVWNATHLERFVGHAFSRVREAALRASARSGLRELRAFCRDAADRGGVVEAVEFLGVVGSIDDLARLRRAVTNPQLAKAAVGGLGRLALVAGVPVLLDCLSTPDLVEAAAAAIQRITGLEVPRGALPEPPPELTEDELDFWEPVAPVDVTATREWWQANASRFDPEKRWQSGLCVSDDPLGAVFDQLPLGVRYDVYLRERALTPGTPDWELETWSWKQKNPGG